MLTTNVFEMVFKGTVPTTGSGTKNIFNVFHYRVVSGTPDSVANMMSAIETPLWSSFAPAVLSIDYTSVDTLGRWLDDATVQYLSGGATTSGNVALPRLMTDVAMVLRMKGVERGKSSRGSKHFGAVPTAFVTKDELNATGIAAWGTFPAQFAASITTSNGSVIQPFVLSRKNSQLKVNPTTIYGTDVGSCILNKTIGTMRRRREKTVI